MPSTTLTASTHCPLDQGTSPASPCPTNQKETPSAISRAAVPGILSIGGRGSRRETDRRSVWVTCRSAPRREAARGRPAERRRDSRCIGSPMNRRRPPHECRRAVPDDLRLAPGRRLQQTLDHARREDRVRPGRVSPHRAPPTLELDGSRGKTRCHRRPGPRSRSAGTPAPSRDSRRPRLPR